MSFQISLTNVLIMLMYMIPGFIMCKVRKVNASHLSSISAILIYVFSPCMIISAFMDMSFDMSRFKEMAFFFVISLTMQCMFVAIMYLILRKRFNIDKYRMLTIASVLGNVGFFGMPLLRALFPDNPEAVCYSSIYVVSMNILVFTIGIYCLTLDKKYMTGKAVILNPSTLAFVVAIILYITNGNQYVPVQLSDSISLLGRMTTPTCMLVLGVRLATMPIKKLFANPFVYLICICKQLIYPIFCFGLVFFLPFTPVFKASILMLAAAPCASIILNLAEIHHSQEKMAASCLLFSTISCVCTIPLLSLLI